VSVALRTYLRYLVPLTLLSALALSPLVYLALAVDTPKDAAQARGLVMLAWTAGATAWIGQLLLVAGAAPAARGLVAGAALSQRRAFTRGAVAMVRALVPCLLAAAAVVVGALALVVPALVLVTLLALTGASPETNPPLPLSRLRDSIAAVRAHVTPVAATVAAIAFFDVALVLVAKRFSAPLMGKKPTATELAAYRHLIDIVVAGLVLASPLAAATLASLRATRDDHIT
jgi:hypothetical protein